MASLKNLVVQTPQDAAILVQATGSTAIDFSSCSSVAVQVAVTVSTPANKTFASTAVDTTADTVTLAAHGYATGTAVQVSNPGTLPTGISAVTTYYLIAVDADTLAFATTLQLANAGTKRDLSAQGTGTNTINVTALAGGAAQLQGSLDGTNWFNEGSSQSITVTAVLSFKDATPCWQYYRVLFAVTSGQLTVTTKVLGKGPN